MEFKEQSVPTGILLKIRKLQALAERGVDGEATNAKSYCLPCARNTVSMSQNLMKKRNSGMSSR
jgi:hypothetical protein